MPFLGPNYVSPESMTNLKYNGNPGSGTSTPTHLRSKHSSLSEEPGYENSDKVS